MSYTPTQDDINLLYQRHKKLYSKVNLLNSDFRTIDSLEGVLTNGTLTIINKRKYRQDFVTCCS